MSEMKLLELHHITKRYPGVVALDNVSISFNEGEVHALVGENGAGKSTFIKTISGAVTPDEGEIVFDGETYAHLTPQKALELGISVVYQEMVQFEAMSVADNLFMTDGSDTGFFVDEAERCKRAETLLARFQCHVSPRAKIRDLSMANRQIVEICKAMLRNARVLILDEPTASITVEEQRRLFDVIRELKAQGVTMIYISHRLEELFEICDRVSILRDGKYVDTLDIDNTDKRKLIKLMVGRELSEKYPEKTVPASDEIVLRVDGLSGNGVRGVSFELHKSEILGFAGLVGAGRTERMHIIYGAARVATGTMTLNGERLMLKSTSEDYGNRMHIKAPSIRLNAASLSGGNQQKVVIAKSLASLPDILIFDEPTRGIDIGARYEIYQLMIELAAAGKSILMVSSDMEELLGMSERIVVLHEGEQTGIIEKADFSQEHVLALASGLN